ncbi:hypothetical protein C8T65DRAFT_728015 [Cerioporus squamosus]|nr:hypothetical protein C8T65DRAFT_728015 [Cerioporus squamosus]
MRTRTLQPPHSPLESLYNSASSYNPTLQSAMQIISLTTTLTVLALALTSTANPSAKRNACRRADGSIELREYDGSLIPRADSCTLANAGGPGAPLPNSWCKSTGSEFPCCVENGVGGAFCTDCTHVIHNC